MNGIFQILKKLYFKKNISYVCVLILLSVILIGCNSKATDDNIKTLNFKLYELSTFDSLSNVLGISQYGHTMYIFSETDDNKICQFSSIDGRTWSKQNILEEFLADNKNISICCMDLDENGNVTVAYEVIDTDGTVKSSNIWCDADRQSIELESLEIKRLICNKEKRYVYDGNKIIVYDKSFANKSLSVDVTNMVDFCVNESNLAVLDDNGIIIYDVDNGEKKVVDTVFVDKYKKDIEKTKESFGYDALSCRLVMQYVDANKLCFALEDGMYIYEISDKQIKSLFNKDDNEYKSTIDVLYGYIIVKDEEDIQEIIAVCSEENEKKSIMFTARERDMKDAEDIQKEKSEITVYSLYYAECIEMMINTFQNNNKDVTVKYAWGIDDNSGVAVSDAVSALNTELLAGKGPDVIVMDGLNIRNYEKAGTLLELSDVETEIVKNEPECLMEIINTYKTDSGVYAIPSKMQFTAVVGNGNDVSAINDIDALIAYINNNSKPNYGNDLNLYEWEAFFDIVYPLYASEIINIDGNYSNDALKEFIDKFKKLYDLEMSRTTQEEITNWINENGQYEQGRNINDLCMTPLYNRNYSGQNIAFTVMNDVSQAWRFYSIKHDTLIGSDKENIANKEYVYHIWENNDGVTYIPTLIFSINANCNDIEASKKFVSYMFSTDIQKQYYSDSVHLRQGNPVNINAIKSLNEDMLQLGTPGGIEKVGDESYLFSSYFTCNEDMDEYIEALKTLKTPISIDAEVEEIIKEQMSEYINGERGADETYDAINNLLGIYLSE